MLSSGEKPGYHKGVVEEERERERDTSVGRSGESMLGGDVGRRVSHAKGVVRTVFVELGSEPCRQLCT